MVSTSSHVQVTRDDYKADSADGTSEAPLARYKAVVAVDFASLTYQTRVTRPPTAPKLAGLRPPIIVPLAAHAPGVTVLLVLPSGR